jgi:hypothetical protein
MSAGPQPLKQQMLAKTETNEEKMEVKQEKIDVKIEENQENM